MIGSLGDVDVKNGGDVSAIVNLERCVSSNMPNAKHDDDDDDDDYYYYYHYDGDADSTI